MLAVLSPAKSLDFSPAEVAVEPTTPALMQDATSLMRTARGLSQKRLRELMGLSQDLAKLNYDRYRRFELPFTADNAMPAGLVFDGQVYKALDARSLAPDDLTWAQDHVAILSGLFGLLRPLDLIQPYRLEMGTRLQTRRGANLYAFWGDKITKELRALLDGHDEPTLVNLASAEYFKAIKPAKLPGPVVTCVFEDWKEHPDEGRVVGFLAKHARGLMARHMIAERVDRREGLEAFAAEGYAFRPDRSTPETLTFSRRFVPVAER